MFLFFFFNDTATTEIYTLSLHDALPISPRRTSTMIRLAHMSDIHVTAPQLEWRTQDYLNKDRKSTRLNSSHANISYAVFCLKKKKRNREVLFVIAPYNNKTKYHDAIDDN